MYNAYIALQEIQPIFLMHMLAFCLSGKVVGSFLDNSTAKAYLYNLGGTVSLFLIPLTCHIQSMTDKHGINLIPA